MMLGGKFQTGTIAGCEQLGFSEMTTPPDRAGGVYYVVCRKLIPQSQFCLACFASAQCPAFRKQFRPGGGMDGTINPAAAQQGGVGGVYDGIYTGKGDVSDDDGKTIQILLGTKDTVTGIT